jgi:hypothetical protein
MSRHPIAASTVLACLLLASAMLLAQAPAQPAAPVTHAGGGAIAGVVLNAKTLSPVPNALLTLTRTKDRAPIGETTTDSEGRFAFNNLADAKYSLNASHRGYIASDFEAHGGVSTAIVTGQNFDTSSLRFLLPPQAIVFGTVTDDSGDPVSSALVSLFLQDNRFGTGKIWRSSQTSTDELGNYEIAHLAPGSYYLAVTAKPWYATIRQPQQDAQGNNVNPSGEGARSPLDVAFPTTYYPDTTDSSSAVPIPVAPGDRVPINVTLHPVPAVHISIHLPSDTANRSAPTPQLHQDVFGFSDFIQSTVSFSGQDDRSGIHAPTTAEITGLAPGQYTLELSGGGDASRSTSIDAQTDRQNLDVSAAPSLADVSGKVVMAGSGPLPSNLFILLRPQDSDSRNEQLQGLQVGADGSFNFHNMRPGAYQVEFSAAWPKIVTRLAARGATVRGHIVTVGSEPVVLSAVIAKSTTTVSGFASLNGKPASGVFVLLAPLDPDAGLEAWRANQSDSDGSFDYPEVAPGEYVLVAIEGGWTLDWANREQMAHYFDKGIRVTVPPHAGDIFVKSPIEAQPK